MSGISIYIPDELKKLAKKRAAQEGFSLSQYIQKLLEKALIDPTDLCTDPISSASFYELKLTKILMRNLFENCILTRFLVEQTNAGFIHEASKSAQDMVKKLIGDNLPTALFSPPTNIEFNDSTENEVAFD